MEKKLSGREEEILKIISKGIKKNGYSPTRQEIADELKIVKNGRSYVQVIIQRLIAKKKIRLGKGWRNLKVINN